MEKKTIFIELPCETIDKIDHWNNMGDRSIFVNELLEKQLERQIHRSSIATELSTNIDTCKETSVSSGEINLVNNQGMIMGRFNINAVSGFEALAEKIIELSNDPAVKIKAQHWRQ